MQPEPAANPDGTGETVTESVALAEHVTRIQHDMLITGEAVVDPNVILVDMLTELLNNPTD